MGGNTAFETRSLICQQFCILWDGDSSFMRMKEANRFIFIAERPKKNANIGWITEDFEVYEAYSYNLSNKDKRQVKKIIFEYLNILEKNGINSEGTQEMQKHYEVETMQFQDEKLRIKIDGREHEFELSAISEKLAHASEIERTTFEISPSGNGIHWPLIDEDLSIDGLLGIQHSPPNIKKAVQV